MVPDSYTQKKGIALPPPHTKLKSQRMKPQNTGPRIGESSESNEGNLGLRVGSAFSDVIVKAHVSRGRGVLFSAGSRRFGEWYGVTFILST